MILLIRSLISTEASLYDLLSLLLIRVYMFSSLVLLLFVIQYKIPLVTNATPAIAQPTGPANAYNTIVI